MPTAVIVNAMKYQAMRLHCQKELPLQHVDNNCCKSLKMSPNIMMEFISMKILDLKPKTIKTHLKHSSPGPC